MLELAVQRETPPARRRWARRHHAQTTAVDLAGVQSLVRTPTVPSPDKTRPQSAKDDVKDESHRSQYGWQRIGTNWIQYLPDL